MPRVPWRLLALVAGPVLALAVYWLLPPGSAGGADAAAGLSAAGRLTLAVAVLMAVWWITEVIPIEATSLVPLALFPLLGVATIRAAAAPYANEVIFLFMGGLMLGLAMERWGLHRRIALIVMSLVGQSPAMLVAGVLLATAVMSMWVSNTATAVMMLPIAVTIAGIVEAGGGVDRLSEPISARRADLPIAEPLLLAVAYGASIGGVGTLIGTPPNALLAGFARDRGFDLSFAGWLWMGLPIVAVFLPVGWIVLTRVMYRVPTRAVPGVADAIAAERRSLGPMSRGEWSVFIVFMAAALSWTLREPIGRVTGLIGRDDAGVKFERLTDAGIAIVAALLLFLIPIDAKRRIFVLDWAHAVRLPWGVLLLFGGGLSLASAMEATGVTAYVGSLFGGLGGLHPLVIVLVVTTAIVFLTEITSNTAIATTLLPALFGAAAAMGMHPYVLVVPAAIGASYAFMLPMGTPPNALVFASGRLTIPRMARVGLVMNLCAVVVIAVITYCAGPWLLGYA